MNTILIVGAVASVFFAVELLASAHRLTPVEGWWARVVSFNAMQAGIALFAAATWDQWMAINRAKFLTNEPIWMQAIIGYILITFIYYWWHRARHEIPLLWRWCHQLHHSPTRLEVVMSFYKHPLELLINGILSSSIIYLILGLDPLAAAFAVLLSGLAELFYHANINTPHWLGYLFQRPEMHRVHHKRGSHHSNYSDLPVWDMMFGTFENPTQASVLVGFPDGNEHRLRDMLLGRRVKA